MSSRKMGKASNSRAASLGKAWWYLRLRHQPVHVGRLATSVGLGKEHNIFSSCRPNLRHMFTIRGDQSGPCHALPPVRPRYVRSRCVHTYTDGVDSWCGLQHGLWNSVNHGRATGGCSRNTPYLANHVAKDGYCPRTT